MSIVSDQGVTRGNPAGIGAPPREEWRGREAAAVLIFAVLSVWAGVASKGFLEADACTHYLYSRFCLQEHHLMTNVWGRPFCTLIYAVPAVLGGRAAVRVFSMVMAVAIAMIVQRIARGQRYRWPVLGLFFLLGQPLVFLHSFSELTELPFALLVALAFWAYQEKKFWAMALLVGLMPTARPEGFGFVLLAAMALILHRRMRWLWLLVLPVAAWSFAGWVQFGIQGPWYLKWWRWLPENWPYSAESPYGRGWFIHFLVLMPVVISPFVFPAMVVGVWKSLQLRIADGGLRIWEHRRVCQILIAVVPLLVFVGHTLLYWRGKMASNGELRYMLVVAPFWALLAAKGWEWVFEEMRWRRPVVWAGVAVLMVIGANLMYRIVPLQLTLDWERSRDVRIWHQTNPWQERYPRLLATHPAMYYFLDQSPTDPHRSAQFHPAHFSADARGIMMIWDETYGQWNANSEMSITPRRLKDLGWVPVRYYERMERTQSGTSPIAELASAIQKDQVGEWFVLLSPYDNRGQPTSHEGEVTIPTTQPAAVP